MNNLAEYPTQIAKPFFVYNEAEDEGAMHKSLLDLGESLLTYLVGIMFGEYKKSGEISEKIEAEFYKYSSRRPSFGVFLSFLRLLKNELNQSILTETLSKKKTYSTVSSYIFEFNLLKEIINQGADNEFSDKLDELRLGRTIGEKGVMEFFDTFIILRNIYAHPEEKAGPKTGKRKWPLGSEYYLCINTAMHDALLSIIEDLDFLKTYKPVLTKLLDSDNSKGEFLLEKGRKENSVVLSLTNKNIDAMSEDLRFLLDSDNNLFIKMYYHDIPQLNPLIAGNIINQEKAKLMEPTLLEMINAKLADDGKIDEMEYLILKDTAKTAAISIDKLFKLIERVKDRLKLDCHVGTPDDKGDIFIEVKDDTSKIVFNPWWLRYFSMAGKIDKNIVANEKEFEKKIFEKIKNLKDSRRNLPINKRIKNEKKRLTTLKQKKSNDLEKLRTKIIARRKSKKLKVSPERMETINDNIKEMKLILNEKKQASDVNIHNTQTTIDTLINLKLEKTKSIDEIIFSLEAQLKDYSESTQWGIHKNLWEEISQYVDYLLGVNLNSNQLQKSAESTEYIFDSEPEWANTANAWQIGNLSFTYWGKIHPVESPLGMAFHVGYAVTNKFKWIPNNILGSVKEVIKKPCSLMWFTQDTKIVKRIDPDCSLQKKKIDICQDLVEAYTEEFLDLGANVLCINKSSESSEACNLIVDEVGVFMSLSRYLKEKDKYTVIQIYSRVWSVDNFIDSGKVNINMVKNYESEMTTLLQLFSNAVIELNNFALENGINKETIKERSDKFSRNQKIMFKEFEKIYPFGTSFKPSVEEDRIWRKYSENELGLDDSLYNQIVQSYRFISNTKV